MNDTLFQQYIKDPQAFLPTQDSCEQMYAFAHQLYESGVYETASQIFTKLVLTDSFAEKYWRGLAASQQMRQDYNAALHAWSMVSLLCEKDPLSHFHAAECLLSINETQDALHALQMAENLLENNESDLKLKSKIAVLIGTQNGYN